MLGRDLERDRLHRERHLMLTRLTSEAERTQGIIVRAAEKSKEGILAMTTPWQERAAACVLKEAEDKLAASLLEVEQL